MVEDNSSRVQSQVQGGVEHSTERGIGQLELSIVVETLLTRIMVEQQELASNRPLQLLREQATSSTLL